jgi:cobalt/nickel transport system permease protein
MLAVTIGVTAWSIKKIKERPEPEEKTVPLMGVMGAFVFAAQMINFSIPGTGSSGHLGGGLLLAILLGPAAGFLTIASVLLIQALFFGDGGLLAYGANVFNMGALTCYVAYPLIYQKFAARGTARSANVGIMLAAVIGLQLGAFAVVLETVLSGKTELPFSTFALFMQPIHLAIGIVEGLVTVAVVSFIRQARPEMLGGTSAVVPGKRITAKGLLAFLGGGALIMAAGLSLLASADPDGLEWSISRTAGENMEAAGGVLHQALSRIQSGLSIFPDYQVPAAGDSVLGASTAGVIGVLATLSLVMAIGFLLRRLSKSRNGAPR